MLAFKATRKDMTCLDFQYELGKLYEFTNELKLCKNGFHFCKNLKDIDSYYPFQDKDYRYFVVEIPDDAEVIDDKNKSVTNRIKFIRELTEQDWIDHGMIREITDKLFHIKYIDGYERWYEYDDQGKLIHTKYSSGYEYWYEYDEKGNAIHIKDCHGIEQWREFDENGNVIRIKNSWALKK